MSKTASRIMGRFINVRPIYICLPLCRGRAYIGMVSDSLTRALKAGKQVYLMNTALANRKVQMASQNVQSHLEQRGPTRYSALSTGPAGTTLISQHNMATALSVPSPSTAPLRRTTLSTLAPCPLPTFTTSHCTKKASLP
jgi:hypothetical protein